MGEVGKFLARRVKVEALCEVPCPVCGASLFDIEKRALSPCRHLLVGHVDLGSLWYGRPGFASGDEQDCDAERARGKRAQRALRRRQPWTRVCLTYDGGPGWTWELTLAWPVGGRSPGSFMEHVDGVLRRLAGRIGLNYDRNSSVERVLRDAGPAEAASLPWMSRSNDGAFEVVGRWGTCDILCPVCGHVIHAFQDGDGTFSFCAHTLELMADGDGPTLRRPPDRRQCCADRRKVYEQIGIFDESEEEEDDVNGDDDEISPHTMAPLVDAPWEQVDLRYEGNPFNWTWRLVVAWPMLQPGPLEFDRAVAEALIDLRAHLESRFGEGEDDSE